MSEFMIQKYLEINNWIESLKREEGQTLTEYALLLVLVAIVVVTAVGLLGGRINEIFSTITKGLVAPPSSP
jgi:pilus assembly protein Flp/PilA